MSARHMVALVACISIAACRRPPEGREVRDFERMRQQQRYDLYEASGVFANGAVEQAPPAHTVPRDRSLASRGETRSLAFMTGAANGTDVTVIPMPVDGRTLTAGASQFAISCVPCHGAGGYGGGTIAPNLLDKRPPSLRTPPVSTLPVGTIFKVITEGFGRMPPYGWQLAPAARWAVIAYVKSLATQPATAATRADSAMAAYLQQLDSARAKQTAPSAASASGAAK